MNIIYVSLSVLLIGYVTAAGNYESTEAPVTTQQPTTQPPAAPTTQLPTTQPTTQPKPNPIVTTQKPVSTTEPLSPKEGNQEIIFSYRQMIFNVLTAVKLFKELII